MFSSTCPDGGEHIAAAASAAGLGSTAPLGKEPVAQQVVAALIEAAAQLPGIRMEIGVIAKGIQPFADQAGFSSKQAAGADGRGGWLLLAGLGGLLLLLLIER